jgi:mono/diheme cytochrome c family protein
MAPPHNNDGHTWHHPDQVNFATAWLGRTIAGTMPSFRDKLSPDELILILAYIKTWWNEDSLAVQLDRTRATARQ